MTTPSIRRLILVLGPLLLHAPVRAQLPAGTSPHVQVGLRMVGHAVLLAVGDSTSLVLPVQQEARTYLIPFGVEFAFVPERVAAVVDSVMKATRLSADYVVEMERCGTREVVHSYEHRAADTLAIMPCTSRALPRACYTMRVTLLDAGEDNTQMAGAPVVSPNTPASPIGWLAASSLAFVAALMAFLVFRRKATPVHVQSDTAVPLGAFHFDRAKLELIIQDQKVELSGKEAELLHLLHGHLNETVAREVMLKEVWGNESDYVGRTLDVFVSKLRKKLEADPNVRIANIRGVGYRLILDN